MSKQPTVVFDDEMYDAQFARTLSAGNAGMADLGECFATAHEIGKPTPQTWHDGWRSRADAVAAIADATTVPATRRSALLRASEYYRQALFFLRHDIADARLLDAHRRHVETFQAALPLLDAHTEQIAVPFGTASLKGYFFAPDDSGVARPTVLAPCGYDSTAEEGYAWVAAALERGYNAVSFEGPGQGAALYIDHLTFDPDFAPVVTAVIDVLVTRPDVDADRLVLVGLSFAGYLAPQAATREHRLAALVCNPAQPDMAEHIPSGLAGKVAAPVVRAEMRLSADKAEFFGARMAAHGITDVDDYFAELHRFDMTDAAGQITCPTLILECEGDFAGGGGTALQKVMTAPTTLIDLTVAEGAGGHCGGLGQKVWEGRVYDWLAGILTGDAANV
ncbi:MAG: alpha/beta fold hydrolase [Ilumatobacteraceae bacterium]